MKRHMYILIVVYLTMLVPCNGQQKLSPDDYGQWHYLGSGTASPDGKWVTYFKRYPDADTLFLKHIPSETISKFPQAVKHLFTKDGTKFVVAKKGMLSIIDLRSGISKEVVSNGYLLAVSNSSILNYDPEKEKLEVIDMHTLHCIVLQNIVEASVNPVKEEVALIQKKSVDNVSRIIVLRYKKEAEIKELTVDRNDQFAFLTWEKGGNSLCFYRLTSEGAAKGIVLVTMKNRSHPQLKELDFGNPYLTTTLKPVDSSLFISADGQGVFFEAAPISIKETGVEDRDLPGKPVIWTVSTNNPFEITEPALKPQTHVWWANSDTIIPVETIEHPNVVLTGNHRYALVFDESIYKPSFKYQGDYNDYYLMDLTSGKKELLLKKQAYARNYTQVSPEGKYICYFKLGNWWTYNIKSKKHNCITKGINDIFIVPGYDMPGISAINSVGGWTESDKEVYIHGRYDIYRIAADGSSFKKLTDGEVSGTTFRMYDDGTVPGNGDKIAGFMGKVIATDNTVIHSVNTKTLAEGFHLYNGSIIQDLVTGNKNYYSIIKIPGRKSWMFFENDFDQPATLYNIIEDQPPKIIARANEQQEKYFWGKSELIKYTVDDQILKGALFYPAGYDPSLQYPMIVVVYEKMSHTLHKYSMPSQRSDNGINISNFTQHGYFVLCPDIAYKENEAGASALNCVKAAVAKAVEGRSIDRDRLGLIGHSFGGYETTYIIGQSTIFKTAIAGSAVTDIRSFYLSLTKDNQLNLEKFEGYQFRMLLPYLDTKFEENSPINYADKIQTPLMMWASVEDQIVPYNQSIELQIALWRMGKKSTLILFPNEEHSLVYDINQKDLSDKVLQWFGHYLQDAPVLPWM